MYNFCTYQESYVINGRRGQHYLTFTVSFPDLSQPSGGKDPTFHNTVGSEYEIRTVIELWRFL